jgi:hypothetical protein
MEVTQRLTAGASKAQQTPGTLCRARHIAPHKMRDLDTFDTLRGD